MIMGVELADCRPVAQLIGIKTFFNEFIAYERLSQFILNSRTLDSYNGTISYTKDDIYLVDTNTTLVGGVMSVSTCLSLFYTTSKTSEPLKTRVGHPIIKKKLVVGPVKLVHS